MTTQISVYMRVLTMSGNGRGRRLSRKTTFMSLLALLVCAGWLAPGKASAATDVYNFQNVASSSVCIGTSTINQSGAANASPTGPTLMIELPFSETYAHASWNSSALATSLADDMYTAPFAADSTISAISLSVEHTWNSTNSPVQKSYAKFYDMDTTAACPGFEQGVLIGQTGELNWPSWGPTPFGLKLENILYNIRAGHRIRIELWNTLHNHSFSNFMRLHYGSTITRSYLTVTHTPTLIDINTVGPGTAPPTVTIAPGSLATDLDAFTLQTSAGTDTVQGVTVTLFPAGAARTIKEIQITSDDGATIYGKLVDPLSTATVFEIPLTTYISATTTEASYKIRILPQVHASMPAAPGAAFAVQGQVTRLASLYTKVYNDTPDATVTIDNNSPANPAWGTLANGDGQNTLNWTNPADTDFSDILLLRGTVAVVATPVEGTTYTAGATIGNGTVIAAGNLQTFTDTGRTNDTSYYYRIFSRDQNGNYSTGLAAGPLIPGTNVCTIGNGVALSNKAIASNESTRTDLDTFTLQSSPSAKVTSVTITLSPGAWQYMGLLELTNDSGGAYRTLDYLSISGDTVTFSGLSIPITGTVSSYRVKMLPKSSNPPPAGAEVAITGTITAITLDMPSIVVTNNDTTSATLTIDRKAPANPVLQYANPADGNVNMRWTDPADADTIGTLILRNTVPVTDAPQDGTSYTGYNGNIGASLLVCNTRFYSPSTVENLSWTTAVNGTTYYYKLFARDARHNYSTGLAVGPVTPDVTVTVGNGTEPANAVVAPESSAAPLDAFTLAATSSATVDSVTATLSAGALAVVGSVRMASGDGSTVYGSVSNPATEAVTIPTAGIAATTTAAAYRIEIIPKTHVDVPAVPGSEVAVTGRVTAITTAASSYKAYNDTASATVTVDNKSPDNPAGVAAISLDGGFSVSWTNPPDADFSSILVLRDSASVTDLPVEGVSYTAGMTIGTGTVAYAGSQQSFIERGLTNGSNYHYRLFARDSRGNYSAVGSPIGPLSPLPNDQTVAGVATATMQGIDAIAVNMPFTDDANSNGTCTVEYQLSSGGAWTPWPSGITRSTTECATTITGLTAGIRYDVRMTYADSDGVMGAATQTVTRVVALSLVQTTVGTVTAALTDSSTITVTAPFTNDVNHDNSFFLEYKQSSDSDWIAWGYYFGPPDSPYIMPMGGLWQLVSHDVRATFSDPDGVTGAAVQTITGLIAPSQKNPNLIHNSINANDKNYWSWAGGWGVPGGMYGEFTCETCHVKRTTNASGIRTVIMGKPVIFKGTTGPNSFGDDSVPKPDIQPGAYKICEACHTQTYGRVGWEENPPGSGTWVPIDGPVHQNTTSAPSDHAISNGRDCTDCHPHNKGFRVKMGP